MKQKIQFVAVFLLSSVFSFGQDQYDTLLTLRYWRKGYVDDSPKVFHPVLKEIRTYDNKRRISSRNYYEYPNNKPVPFLYRKEAYMYGPNDSLKTVYINEVPYGGKEFFLIEVRDYSYKNRLLDEVKTTIYAINEGQRYNNKAAARHWIEMRGGSVTDTSFWKTVSATRYYYDDVDRLVKKAQFHDYNDKHPEIMWLYNYGKELPNINDYFQPGYWNTLQKVYNHLYKNGKLIVYRVETESGGVIEIQTRNYDYNNKGQIEKVAISEKEMRRKNATSQFKQDGKDEVTDKEEYKYTNGVLTTIVHEYKSAYTKYKPSLLDALAGMPRVSTSTTRYGDYQTTTTTVTSSQSGPPNMIAKTKYKWRSYTMNYVTDESGRRVVGGWEKRNKCIYDAKGRVKEYTYFDTPIDGPTGIKLVYGYKN